MHLKKLVSELEFLPSKEEVFAIKKESQLLSDAIKKEIKKQGIEAEVFIGGSVAKGTLVKKSLLDIDFFIRFDWRYEEISGRLEKIVKSVGKKLKLKYKKVHGSRDYFRIEKKNIIFEIIPVLKIKNPKEARNVTDLSYFHVNYIRKRINQDMAKEVSLAKYFCKAQGFYGAESYIKGFSGYGLECLIINYRSFEKMLKELAKVKERLILDPEKRYKKKEDIIFSMNENKLQSPVVIVDPTWRERNVLAALSVKTFRKFQEAAKSFLKNPSKSFFNDKKIDLKSLNKIAKNHELLHFQIITEKQEGDIAGTKLKKFADFFSLEISRFFTILKDEFEYDDQHKADVYLVLDSKKEIVKKGPPLSMKDNVLSFKLRNKDVFEKEDYIYSRIKITFSGREYLRKFKKENKKKTKEMDIKEIKII